MKYLAALALLFFTSVAVTYAKPELAYARAGATPYDRYMGSVHTVLRRLDGGKPSLSKVSSLLREGYSFRYVFDTPYVAPMPDETAARRAGDCKGKSLWLADRMNDPSVRYIIGKARRDSAISHAWLMWQSNNRWWILDPTNSSRPIPADRVGPDEYLVSYSYTRNGSYRHQLPQREYRAVGQRRTFR